jgi:NitT/TauT family transport system ATP-binding protein
VIEMRNIRKTFRKREGAGGRGPVEVQALDRIDLTVKANEFLTVIGPSGCGKTTLLKIVAGLVRPDSGEVKIAGRPVEGPGPDRSIVFQRFALLPWADVLTNVGFGLEMRGVPRQERHEKAIGQINSMGLAGFEHHYPHELSGGMQQRVGLARALVVDPQILLMDEPFGSLDAQTRRLLQDDLLQLWQAKQKTVIFVTHSMEEAVYLSDRIGLMSPRPGCIMELIEVSLPRPRTEEVQKEKAFVELKEYLWAALKEMQAAPAAA